MTVGDWLRARPLQPPETLSARIATVLGAAQHESSDALADVCLDAAERLVADLLRSGSTSRDTALDLLTADALVTYAFEAASDRPETIAARAEAAMVRIAALGAVQPA
ncbi:MAG: hypothetical protein ABIY52_10335 [Gemmatimonadaceae bacterium]